MRSSSPSTPGSGGGSSKKKKKKVKSKESPLSDPSPPSTPPSSAAEESESYSLLPAGLRLLTPVKESAVVAKVVETKVADVVVSKPVEVVASGAEERIVLPAPPNPTAPLFVFLDSVEEASWKSADVNTKSGVMMLGSGGGPMLGGGRRTPRSRAASNDSEAAPAPGRASGAIKLEPVAEEKDAKEGEAGEGTPFKVNKRKGGFTATDDVSTKRPR